MKDKKSTPETFRKKYISKMPLKIIPIGLKKEVTMRININSNEIKIAISKWLEGEGQKVDLSDIDIYDQDGLQIADPYVLIDVQTYNDDIPF